MPERETDLAKGGKRKRKNEGPIWCLLVVVACDGDDWRGGGDLWRSNKGSMRRESSG